MYKSATPLNIHSASPARAIIFITIFISRIPKRKQYLNSFSFYCPGKEAAVVILVVSLPCTAYQCAALIAF